MVRRRGGRACRFNLVQNQLVKRAASKTDAVRTDFSSEQNTPDLKLCTETHADPAILQPSPSMQAHTCYFVESL